MSVSLDSLLAVGRIVQIIGPALKGLIVAAESALPDSGQGAAKLALVKGWIQTALAEEADLEKVWPYVKALIDLLVPILTKAVTA